MKIISEIKSEIGPVKLVVVTKSRTIEEIKQAVSEGDSIIAENRIQEAEQKYSEIKKLNIEFHFIGNLQTNKVKKAVRMFDLIQSVGSLKLAKEIDKRAKEINKIQDILIEINVGKEPQKYGVLPDEIIGFVRQIQQFQNIKVKGLMCMPPFNENPRPYFKEMKRIFDKIKGVRGINPLIKKQKNKFNLLSMGMSNDYKLAIKEGSNMVRIGTLIFGERKY